MLCFIWLQASNEERLRAARERLAATKQQHNYTQRQQERLMENEAANRTSIDSEEASAFDEIRKRYDTETEEQKGRYNIGAEEQRIRDDIMVRELESQADAIEREAIAEKMPNKLSIRFPDPLDFGIPREYELTPEERKSWIRNRNIAAFYETNEPFFILLSPSQQSQSKKTVIAAWVDAEDDGSFRVSPLCKIVGQNASYPGYFGENKYFGFPFPRNHEPFTWSDIVRNINNPTPVMLREDPSGGRMFTFERPEMFLLPGGLINILNNEKGLDYSLVANISRLQKDPEFPLNNYKLDANQLAFAIQKRILSKTSVPAFLQEETEKSLQELEDLHLL